MDETKKSPFQSDLKILAVLFILVVLAIAALYIVDLRTSYLTELAAKLMSGVR